MESSKEAFLEQLSITSLEWQDHEPHEFKNLKYQILPGFHPKMLEHARFVDSRFAYKQVQWDSFFYDMAARDDRISISDRVNRAINVYFGRGNSFVEWTIEIDEYDDQFVCSTSVVRHDAERTLPQGVGRVGLLVSETFLRDLASSSHKRILHRLDRSPGYGGEPLSEDAWDRIFFPILEKGGYRMEAPGVFAKNIDPDGHEG